MSNANALELIMLNLVNGEREAAGLEPLRLITLLNASAEEHSRWMLEADQFSHLGEDGSTPSDRMEAAGYPFEGNYLSAENIAWQSSRGEEGFEDDVAQLHANLMSSPDHRANILDPNAEDIGIGIEIGTFTGASGDFEAIMATQNFGRTATDISAWIDPMTGEDDAVDPPVVDDPVDETPDMEDEPMVEDDPVTDEPVEDDPEVVACDMYDDGDEEIAEDDEVVTDTGDDTESEDDVFVENEEDAEDEGDEDDDEVVAENEDTPEEDDPYGEDTDEDMDDDETEEDDELAEDEQSDDGQEDDGEDVAMDDPEVLTPEIIMPCDLANFTLDLSEAFEFRQEGDQLIWETSEEKLMEAFQKAFNEQMGIEEDNAVEDTMAALMLDDMEDAPACMMLEESDATEDWLLDGCGA